MKRLVVFALMLAILLAGCASSATGDAGATLEPAGTGAPEPTRDPGAAGEAQNFARLNLVRREQTYGGGNALIYPAVDSAEYDALNAAIFKKIVAGLGELDAPAYTYFNIKCNQDGILSLLVGYYDMDTRALCLKLPMTFDVATAKEIPLENCFSVDDDAWRSVIPDLVRQQAELIDMTLLSDVMPIGDGQLYYLTGRTLVVLYRPYEITTNLAGWPEFSFQLDQLSPYLSRTAAIARLSAARQTASEADKG
ncbi:MAG: hypothetical protein BWY35_01074 [Firmicutes bacterium ADurb.Bin248]|nr:MAG: hypothetical protein BWY35_01074 [Firmicutes bacterium ADurb.Bin248]HOG00012.1 hypothetical protein [Clostridia bacterium]HPK14489.1 hypothetical protein [Clostridia bacterium]